MIRRALVHRISASAPDDVSGIAAAIDAGRIDPKGVIAVLGKTEGNGLVNDFSRGHAHARVEAAVPAPSSGGAADQICLVMSGGTEGGMAPHWVVFERADDGTAGPSPALAIGRAHTPPLPFEQLGRIVRGRAGGGRRACAMEDAGITDPADVHFVQIKCPLLTAQRIGEADARGVNGRDARHAEIDGPVARRQARSARRSRSARSSARDFRCRHRRQFRLWSGRASASAGIELIQPRDRRARHVGERGPARSRSITPSWRTPSTSSRCAQRWRGSALRRKDNCARAAQAAHRRARQGGGQP